MPQNAISATCSNQVLDTKWSIHMYRTNKFIMKQKMTDQQLAVFPTADHEIVMLHTRTFSTHRRQ
jgi:hypothetical protein